jgi:hypothetical protein
MYTWVFIVDNKSYTVSTENDSKYEAEEKLAMYIYKLQAHWVRKIRKAITTMNAYLEKGPLAA